LIDDVLKNNPNLEALLAGAAVGRKTRDEALQKAFQGRASTVFFNFLMVLNHHDRLDLIRPVRFGRQELSDYRARRLRVYVYSAVPLNDEFRGRLENGVREVFKLEPALVLIVDQAVLGGLKIRIGDRVLDATVRTRIDNLRNLLMAR